jgi:hypothetical protein
MAVLGYSPFDGHLWSEYLTTGPGVVVYIFTILVALCGLAGVREAMLRSANSALHVDEAISAFETCMTRAAKRLTHDDNARKAEEVRLRVWHGAKGDKAPPDIQIGSTKFVIQELAWSKRGTK